MGKIRKTWEIDPVTRVKKSKNRYKRTEAKDELKEILKEYEEKNELS